MGLRILLQSNFHIMASGYGASSLNLLQIWKSIGHEVAIFAVPGIEGAIKEIDGFLTYPRGTDTWGNDIVWSHVKAFGADLLITNMDTFVLRSYGNSYKPWIPITPIMEDPLSPGTAGSLNGAYSIVSISEYGKLVLQDARYSSTLIPLPVDTGRYHPLNREEAKRALGFPDGCFLITNVGMNRSYRKGQDLLIQAMPAVLSEIPNAYLYIHTDTKQSDGLRLDNLSERLGIASRIRFPPRYEYFVGEFPTEWMQQLYSATDVYVQPSTNEGQGLPVWEASSCGAVVVATDCTALTDFLQGSEGIGLPVANRSMQASESYSYHTSSNAVAAAIIEAYRKWGRNYCSAINRQWAIENVSLPVIGHKWQDFLFNIEKKVRYSPQSKPFGEKVISTQEADGKTVETLRSNIPRIASVSTLVENCGIGQYTRMLNAGLGEATEVIPVDILNIHPEDAGDADLIHVQHEPSIQTKELELAMRVWKTEGRRVVVTYHNIDPGLISRHINEGMVDVAIIHWPPPNGQDIPDSPHLKILGGMGCPVFELPKWSTRENARRTKFNFQPDETVITTFGFAAGGRGHVEVPEEMCAYLLSHPKVRLQVITPGNFLNDLGLQFVKGKLTELVEKYNLHRQIIFITDFIPDKEVLERMWCSDVGFAYLGLNTASTSSAMRFFISARLPTVITASTHFADVRHGVVITGSGLSEFCNAILNLSQDREKRARLMREHESTYQRWNYPAFSERILNIYKEVLGR